MPTLAESLGTTAHCSVLRRKARRLGVETLDQAIALAAERGCRHYRHVVDAAAPAISRDESAFWKPESLKVQGHNGQ